MLFYTTLYNTVHGMIGCYIIHCQLYISHYIICVYIYIRVKSCSHSVCIKALGFLNFFGLGSLESRLFQLNVDFRAQLGPRLWGTSAGEGLPDNCNFCW